MSQPDPFDHAALEAQQQRRGDKAKLEAQREADDLKWLMGSRRGRRLVWRQLERAGVFRLSFNTNAMQMAFAEGGRNEGLRTLAQIHATCPESYAEMLKEQTSE